MLPVARTRTTQAEERGPIRMSMKTAVVTGGAGGLGKAIAEGLRENGWDLALVDVAETVHETAADLGGQGLRCDITDRAARAEILSIVSSPRALINCAGIVSLTPALNVPEAQWRRIMEVNLHAPFFLSQEVARNMTDGGAIVNIASVSGLRAGFGRMSYGVSKAALIHMTKQFALELAPRGITSNAIAPGPVEGDMARVHPPDQVADYLKTIPQARYAKAKDIADAVVFLCTPAAAHITGQCIAVDGGWTAAGVGVAAAQRQT